MGQRTEATNLLRDLESVMLQIGRIPSRVEYQKLGRYPTQAILDVFGSYALMLKAAGLSHSKGKVTKQEKEVQAFEHRKKEIEEKRSFKLPPKVYHRVLVLSDLHAPMHHPDAISFILAIKEKYQPDLVISVGDEINGQALSFHQHDVDLPSAGHELTEAIRALKPLYDAFPEMLIAESNHGSLVWRRAKANGLPVRVLKSYRDVLEAPQGWNWMEEIEFQLSNGKKCLVHHSMQGKALLYSMARAACVIWGHHHSLLSVEYWASKDNLYWAMQVGCLIDPESAAYTYNKLQMRRPIIGLGLILEGTPVPVAMPLNSVGRWTGAVP